MKYILLLISVFFSSSILADSTKFSVESRGKFNETGFLSLHRVNGEVAGLMVRQSDNDEQLASADILVGDLIVEINGHDLTDVKSVMGAYTALIEAQKINFVYFRGNQPNVRRSTIEFVGQD